jgi:hypothetical protein
MNTPHTLIDLEKKFWQSMVDNDPDSAVELLHEPSMMVGSHGAMQFDRAGYRKMADEMKMQVTAFEFSDIHVVFPNDTTGIVTYKVKQSVAERGDAKPKVQVMNDSSTWIQTGKGWQCVMHTETPNS